MNLRSDKRSEITFVASWQMHVRTWVMAFAMGSSRAGAGGSAALGGSDWLADREMAACRKKKKEKEIEQEK